MVTRRTTRRKLARTSRSLRSNARPIKIDPALVNELFRFIEQKVEKFKFHLGLERGEGLVWTEEQLQDWSGTRIAVQKVFRLKDVSGDEKNYILNIRVQDVKRPEVAGTFENLDLVIARSRYPGMSRTARRVRNEARKDLQTLTARAASGFVNVYLIPREFTQDGQKKHNWHQINGEGSLMRLRETLIHELIHASEKHITFATAPFPEYDEWMKQIYEKAGVPVTLDEAGDDRSRADLDAGLKSYEKDAGYLNQYIELRAYMADILSEIRLQVLLSIRQLFHDDALTPRAAANAIQNALAESPNWARMELVLGRKGRNILLKGIVTALEDEGIITIE